MKTICIANHKGGCAKTTTALNVTATLAATGSRVLAVDLDPQGNLSASLGADLEDIEQSHLTTHRLMLGINRPDKKHLAQKGRVKNLSPTIRITPRSPTAVQPSIA